MLIVIPDAKFENQEIEIKVDSLNEDVNIITQNNIPVRYGINNFKGIITFVYKNDEYDIVGYKEDEGSTYSYIGHRWSKIKGNNDEFREKVKNDISIYIDDILDKFEKQNLNFSNDVYLFKFEIQLTNKASEHFDYHKGTIYSLKKENRNNSFCMD